MNSRQKMSSLLDPLLNVLPPLLAEKNSEDLTEALTSLIELASEHPKMFKDSFAHLVQYSISVIKETQLEGVQAGQAVDIDVDGYPGHPYRGHVLSVLRATGAATTLLPPDNATGNFTKIVQRVPVKISIEAKSAADLNQLRQGMSVTATIDTAHSDSSQRGDK